MDLGRLLCPNERLIGKAILTTNEKERQTGWRIDVKMVEQGDIGEEEDEDENEELKYEEKMLKKMKKKKKKKKKNEEKRCY
ncbi:hypothetical protein M0802_012537 [Mischocyttarus mexicanus]|nr:hypothetical protein M0802_012564 [Mischocyttarus mexicanus]KAI4486138.1 hypothetical protein M0802_012537 [Mischocyttarus mexicanus]